MITLDLTLGCYIPLSLKKYRPKIYKRGGGAKEVTYTSLRREKLWILRTKKFIGLPCSLLLRVTAPLNLEESNRSMPHDLVLLIQNLHKMFQIRQVGNEGCDIIDNDIHGGFKHFFN
jgi:hypothetical protein